MFFLYFSSEIRLGTWSFQVSSTSDATEGSSTTTSVLVCPPPCDATHRVTQTRLSKSQTYGTISVNVMGREYCPSESPRRN